MLPSDVATWSQAMGIHWMTAAELADAIPPAFTAFVGAQLLAHLEAAA
jgi:DNA (cytosine-5)-methyltransferase 1